MRTLLLAAGLLAAAVAAVAAQVAEPPVADTRIAVHTLVREDIFAGFLQNDLARLTRAEKNLQLLLASRPAERPGLLAWQGSVALTRAAAAHEANQPAQFRQHLQRAQQLFTEAMTLGPDAVAVFAIVGGSQASIADRLPSAERAAGWEQAYSAYQRLWTMQGAIIDKLPLHHAGEVLSGLAQSAQRTGRDQELMQHLDRMLSLLAGTPYAARATQWKNDPAVRPQVRLTCQTCHAPGTLAARLAEVSKQP